MYPNSHINPAHWQAIQRETPSLVTMGNFDGVHKGHVALLQALKEQAVKLNAEPLVVTFLPHPKDFFQNFQKEKNSNSANEAQSSHHASLSSPSEKQHLVKQEGVNVLFVEFEESFANLEPQEFIQEFLKKRLLAKGCMQGPHHRFGKGAKGNYQMLKQAFGKGFTTTIPPLAFSLKGKDIRISSSLIREHLSVGKVEEAKRLLGRPYSYKGTVITGDGRGRQLGFPTANVSLNTHEKLCIASGVYGADVILENGESYQAVVNMGSRPTFYTPPSQSSATNAEETPTITNSVEVHILNFDGDLYEKQLEVQFQSFLRKEKKFNSSEELVQQIKRDIEGFKKNN